MPSMSWVATYKLHLASVPDFCGQAGLQSAGAKVMIVGECLAVFCVLVYLCVAHHILH